MPKIFNHPYRKRMVNKLCLDIYKLKQSDISDDLHEDLSALTYQEIIKPLIFKDFKDESKNTDLARLSIKYGVTKSVIRSIMICLKDK